MLGKLPQIANAHGWLIYPRKHKKQARWLEFFHQSLLMISNRFLTKVQVSNQYIIVLSCNFRKVIQLSHKGEFGTNVLQ